MTKIKTKVIVLLTLFLTLGAMMSCKNTMESVAGVYVDDEGEFLVLNTNGTIYAQGIAVGKWEIEGNEVIIKPYNINETAKGKIKRDRLVFKDGKKEYVWRKSKISSKTNDNNLKATAPLTIGIKKMFSYLTNISNKLFVKKEQDLKENKDVPSSSTYLPPSSEDTHTKSDFTQSSSCQPCVGKTFPELKQKLANGEIGSLSLFPKLGLAIEKWASSTLKAEGTPPKIINESEARYPEEYLESLCDYASWSCMYSPYSAMDRNPQTAWVEGVPGDGIGEFVIVRVDTDKPVKIWAGYGKSKDTFNNNNRPQWVRVYVLEGKQEIESEAGISFSNIKVVASHEVLLEDINGYQPLSLPEHVINRGMVSFVAVEILSVYPGAKYNDTCISEIAN